MWKEYSAQSIRQNRASSLSAAAAALLAALLLSLLCGLFYNLWQDEVQRITAAEGGWHARLHAELTEEDLACVRSFANVARAERDGDETVLLWFSRPRTVYRDLPLILQKLGLGPEAGEYHTLLLSRFLIHDPQDEDPPLLVSFYLAVLAAASLSLVLVIHNSFALSMNERTRQLGILASVGATPGQIWRCLMQEAAALCAVPVLAGTGLGAVLCRAVLRAAGAWAAGRGLRQEVTFRYPPLLFAGAAALAGLTVLVSACIPARRLSRCTPLEAIRSPEGLYLRKRRRTPVLSALFGAEGELAGSALKAQSRALRTSTLSLTLSFLGFATMLCFFTLSDISTEHTYFARYQDAWDVMVTVQDTSLADFVPAQALRDLPGARDVAVYQRMQAVCRLPAEQQSEALRGLGGLQALAGLAAEADGAYRAEAELVLLDDASFRTYCAQAGLPVRTDGAAAVDRIWDSQNSNFRYRTYVPYLAQDTWNVTLEAGGQTVTLPLLGRTQTEPLLRESYDDYALLLVLPLSLWERAAEPLGPAPATTYVRILAAEGAALEELDALEAAARQQIGAGYALESENRLRERQTNDEMLAGYKLVLGGLCALLAFIGLANIFGNTLGFVALRRREFAQYRSMGMTPAQLKKLFAIEALVLALRPVLVTLPLTGAAVAFMIKASDLDPMEFLVRAPVLPLLAFALAVLSAVAIAYGLAGARVLRGELAADLRDERV